MISHAIEKRPQDALEGVDGSAAICHGMFEPCELFFDE
jgi:hypothetical protein